MTEDKARKRAIRRRMAKTGERYTAARRHVVEESARPAPLAPRVADPGMSDQAVRRATGRDWNGWFRILDAWGATQRRHPEIARFIHEEHGVPGWWAQSVTVGYERARGIRAMHERPEGFSANVSKTWAVDVETLFRAFVDAIERRRWVEPGTLRIRTAQPVRSARFDFRDGSTRVNVNFVARGPSKATVQIQHERLPDAAAVEETKAFWKERLARLAERLT